MGKIITIVAIIILLIGGWYFYSQQEEVEDPTKEEEIEETKEEEIDEDNAYYQYEETPAIPGINAKLHEVSERILTGALDEVKLIDASAEVGSVYSLKYVALEEIDVEQANEIREYILEEDVEITSMDTDASYYRYSYDVELEGEMLDVNMTVTIGDGGGERESQIISISAYVHI